MHKALMLIALTAALALIEQGANAASLNLAIKEHAAGTSVVVQTHACHKLCSHGPYGTTPHRHRLFSCEPRQCIDWGNLFDSLFVKQRRSR
jgi:cytochrome c2